MRIETVNLFRSAPGVLRIPTTRGGRTSLQTVAAQQLSTARISTSRPPRFAAVKLSGFVRLDAIKLSIEPATPAFSQRGSARRY